jgi:uncharacterized Ntn-hydrolase superfamily protein
MTFSIIGLDPTTKSLGIAVSTKWLAVGACVPHVCPGIGAIATQAETNISYGPKGLEMLKEGMSPKDILINLLASDEKSDERQVSILNVSGESATHTGKKCLDWAGSKIGINCMAQGNILVSKLVVSRMIEVFENTQGNLSTRLLEALKAGEKSGGDKRGKQSAALLVSNQATEIIEYSDDFIDLRVDDHKNPIKELEKLLALHQELYKA